MVRGRVSDAAADSGYGGDVMAKWKPVKSEQEYCIAGYPSYQGDGRIGFFMVNTEGVRKIWVWLSTAETKAFGRALVEAAEYNERVNGIRNQDFIFRWC